MSKLRHSVFGATALAAAVPLIACVGTDATLAGKQADAERAAVVTSLLNAQLAESALQPRPLPPPATPRREPDFQFCLVGSQSCMALDPRPFVLCPAAGDPVCDAKGNFELLRAKRPPTTR